MRNRLRTLCPVITLCAALGAQATLVSPLHFTSSEASSGNSFPFGRATAPFRYINIHDDLAGAVRVVRGLSVRRDAMSAANPAYTITLDMWASTATTTATTASSTFDLNHGTDKLQVVTNKTFAFPQTFTGSVPESFVLQVPWDVPFVFLGMAGLCWEAQVTARSNTTDYFIDATSGSNTNPPLYFATYGAGCIASGQTLAMTATGSGTMNWPNGTGTLTVSGNYAPAGQPAILLFGTSNTSWNSIPLPFLIPNTSSGPSGPCSVYTDVALTLVTTASATGATAFPIPFPATAVLNGLRTFEQIVAFDALANPFGVVTSSAVNHNVVAPYGPIPGARVYLSGSLGATGTVGANFALITRFDV